MCPGVDMMCDSLCPGVYMVCDSLCPGVYMMCPGQSVSWCLYDV